jgi:hypothetical protein
LIFSFNDGLTDAEKHDWVRDINGCIAKEQDRIKAVSTFKENNKLLN